MTDYEQLPLKLQRMLEFIENDIRKNGYAPSVREIGSALGIPSTSTVHAQLRSLEDAGFLRRDPAKPRAMVVQNSPLKTPSGDNTPEDALKGLTGQSEQPFSDAAFSRLPFIPFEQITGASFEPDASSGGSPVIHCLIPAGVLKSGPCFVTVMPDDSMVNRQIYAGDYLIVARQNSANNNDMIIGSLDGELLIRSYTKGLRQVRLQVESNEFVISTIDPEELTIYGVVIGVFRLLF